MTEQEKRETVIKGLECLAKQHGIVGVCEPENCQYGDLHTCANEIARDALALLKAQEPVAPVRKSFLVSAPGEYGTTPSMPVCGACGAWLLTVALRAKYCPNCGRAVKWE